MLSVTIQNAHPNLTSMVVLYQVILKNGIYLYLKSKLYIQTYVRKSELQLRGHISIIICKFSTATDEQKLDCSSGNYY